MAIKCVDKSTLIKARTKQRLMQEIKIHRDLKHENIVLYNHFFEDANNVYMVLDLCHNGSLADMLKKRKSIDEIEARYYIKQLLDAVEYCHKKRIIHRDLKLGNILLDKEMTIKLSDFGLAAKLNFEDEKRRTMCGTPNYIAPEVLDSKFGHSYEVDIWAIGVIIYTLIYGKPPFDTADLKTTYKRIRACIYDFPAKNISDEAKDLIR